MFDCGMHMGYNDERRFPDFTALSASKDFDRVIDLVIISHLYFDNGSLKLLILIYFLLVIWIIVVVYHTLQKCVDIMAQF